MVGSLQTNKAAQAARIFDLIQSLDRWPLAQKIDRAASQMGKIQDCLIQIKISEEAVKRGLDPKDLPDFIEKVVRLSHLRIRGIMAMAPWTEPVGTARPYFSTARRLFEQHIARNPKFPESGTPLYLSMGMSRDFEVAIEEGANMVRVGTALFQDPSG